MSDALFAEEARPHWEAAARGTFVLPACATCNHLFWPPAGICPQCLDRTIVWKEVPGSGTVVAAGVFHRQYHQVPWLELPYTVILVALDAGPRIFSNLLEAEAQIGMRVSARFAAVNGDRGIVNFAPAALEGARR